MRASSEIANERKMAGREKERVYSFFFKFHYHVHFLKKGFFCKNVIKYKNVERVQEGFTCATCSTLRDN